MEGRWGKLPVGLQVMEGPLAEARAAFLNLFFLGTQEALGAVGREHPAPLVWPRTRMG